VKTIKDVKKSSKAKALLKLLIENANNKHIIKMIIDTMRYSNDNARVIYRYLRDDNIISIKDYSVNNIKQLYLIEKSIKHNNFNAENHLFITDLKSKILEYKKYTPINQYTPPNPENYQEVTAILDDDTKIYLFISMIELYLNMNFAYVEYALELVNFTEIEKNAIRNYFKKEYNE